ncbi:MAG: hypothetical protein QF380_06595 [Candidatus Marinimicrobia bacterium]|jgi:hypothetical protein|nr:hypothetical protein [Candidatus Neomarinimicrobiota bacterium]
MKKLLTKFIIPICLLIIILTQIYNYINGFRVEKSMLVVVVALMPAAVKGLELNIDENIFKLFERIMVVLAVVGLIYVFWSTM